MSKSITITGLGELRARLANADKNITKAVSFQLGAGANDIAGNAKLRAPGDQGILQNLISAAKIDPLNWQVVSGADYSPYVEFGTGTKVSIPPGLEEYAVQFKGNGASIGLSAKEAIFAWCARHGVDKSAWYAIYISIMANGIKPQPFFFPAVNRQTPLIIDRVNKALGDAI